jgi:glycosyltransferase involved in cell wall biosynthesis
VPADRLSVLVLAHAYPRYTGDPVGSFIHNLVVALRDEGVDVTVVAPGAPGLLPLDHLDGIAVHRFRYAPRRLETLAYSGTMSAQVQRGIAGKILLGSFLLAGFLAARRVMAVQRSSIVHAHWWFPGGLVARLLRATTKTPYLLTLHGSDVRLALASPVARRLFRAVAANSSGVTAVSSWLARGAGEIAPGIPMTVAPMPVRSELFFAGGERDPLRLLFVGKLAPQKGLERLLRAMAGMRVTARLTVVGAGRVDDAHIRQMAGDLGLADRIEWLPILSQENLANQYRRAAVHVIPALDEGLGLTAAESMLCETPVVAFASGGVPDVVLHETTGLLVPPGDEDALAAALDALLADPARRESLGRAGRAHALAAFGAHVVARGYARLYRDAVAHA